MLFEQALSPERRLKRKDRISQGNPVRCNYKFGKDYASMLSPISVAEDTSRMRTFTN